MNFKKFEIKNLSRKRRGGFSHDSTLYFDGVQINKASVHYYNRTWESYPFKTSMRAVVEDMINYNKNQVRRVVFCDWKRLNDVRKKELDQYFKGREFGGYFGQDLLDLLDNINRQKQEPDPIFNSMKAFLLMGDLMTNKTESEADAVAYKERIVFATMRSMVPNWQEPKDWAQLSNAEKMTRLKKLEEVV